MQTNRPLSGPLLSRKLYCSPLLPSTEPLSQPLHRLLLGGASSTCNPIPVPPNKACYVSLPPRVISWPAQTPQYLPYTCTCAHVHSHHKGLQVTRKSEPVGHINANSHFVILAYCFGKCYPWRKLGREYKGCLLFLTNLCKFIIIQKKFFT